MHSSGTLGLVLIVLSLLQVPAAAQSYSIQLHSLDGRQELLQQQLVLPEENADANTVFSFVQALVPALQQKGFLAASVDSIVVTEPDYHVYIYLGQQYKWAKVFLDSIPPGILEPSFVRDNLSAGRPLNPQQLADVTSRLLSWAENNGYPFAQAGLDIIRIDTGGGVYGNLVLDKGAFRKIDSVIVKGEVRISKNYLLHYLDIQEGGAYNEKKIKSVSGKLNQLAFIREAAPWDVEFRLSETRLTLYVKERKANQINALIGLLPNNAESGKFLLTVDALFAFQNILSYGEMISVSYQSLQYKSPRLKADILWPYLFNSSFGADAHFDLYKKDTSFRRSSFELGIRYDLTAGDYFRVFYRNQSNRLITIDTAFVRSKKRLPDNIDVSANGGGAEAGVNRTDYRLNPHRGFEGNVVFSALIRQIRRSDAITGISDGSGFDYASLYDSLSGKSDQYFIHGAFSYYFSLVKNLVLKTNYSAGIVIGKNLFRNELYQVGGFRLLRGFDEQSIYASQYHVLSLEFRVLLDQNSYFYAFSDNGYVETDFNGFYKNDIYNGFGIGTALQVKSGLFSLSYGLGRNENNPIQFRQSKIHFGYVAYF